DLEGVEDRCEHGRVSAAPRAVHRAPAEPPILVDAAAPGRAWRALGPQASTIVQVPPAASMLSRAPALKACAWTVIAFVISPLARTFTEISLRVARPLAFISSSVTSAPASKRSSSAPMLTGWVW